MKTPPVPARQGARARRGKKNYSPLYQETFKRLLSKADDGGKWKINGVEKFLLTPSSLERRSQQNGEDLRGRTVSAHLAVVPHPAGGYTSPHGPFACRELPNRASREASLTME